MGSPQCRESMESREGAASTYCLLPRGALGGPPENEVASAWPQRCAWRPAVPGSTPGPVTSPVALPQPGPRVAGWRSPCWTAPLLPVTRSRQVAVPGPRFHPVASFSLRAACFHLLNSARKLGDAAEIHVGGWSPMGGSTGSPMDVRAARQMQGMW